MSDFFVKDSEVNIKDFEIERLKNEKAVNFYNNFLEITQKQSLKRKVTSTFRITSNIKRRRQIHNFILAHPMVKRPDIASSIPKPRILKTSLRKFKTTFRRQISQLGHR